MPIARLRRIAAALERGEAASPADAAWFASAVRRYEAEAAVGLDLGRALGLVPPPGGDGWWTLVARRKRNEPIRAMRQQHFADMSIPEAARAIATAGLWYKTTRFHQEQLTSDPKKMLLATALETGRPFPGRRQIETILRNEP